MSTFAIVVIFAFIPLNGLNMMLRLALFVSEGREIPWLILLASNLPVACAGIASTVLTRYFSRETQDWEHVMRHFLFSVGFTLSIFAVDSEEISRAAASGKLWAEGLVWLYFIGNAALYYFTLAHIVELWQVRRYGITYVNTHHGDVAVLPLAIATITGLAVLVPMESAAFPFSRSAIYWIPLFVGWATLSFIAYLDFATRNVTPYKDNDYEVIGYAGTLISCGMITIIELTNNIRYFAVFTAIAPLGMQLCSMKVWNKRIPDMSLRLVGTLGACTALNTFAIYGLDISTTTHGLILWAISWAYFLTVALISGRLCIGPLWSLPIAGYMSLILVAYVDAQQGLGSSPTQRVLSLSTISCFSCLLLGTI